MKLRHFKKQLDLLGADLSRWPEDDAGYALDLMARSPEAKNLFRQAETLDRVLNSADVPPPDVRAVEEMITAAVAQPQATSGFVKETPHRSAPSWVHVILWGGSAFVAAMLTLFFAVSPGITPEPRNSAVVAEAEVDEMLRDLDRVIALREQENAESEMLLAELSLIENDRVQRSGTPAVAAATEEAEVDDFLDSLEAAPVEESPSPDTREDIWKYFMDMPQPPTPSDG